MNPRVLFVSKAVAPPLRDGAACLVRHLADALRDARPTVLSTDDAPALAQHVRMDRIYRRRSRYAPAMTDNARVAAHLLRDSRHDLWHFVFAPNPASSSVAKVLRAIRRKPVVQTVASRPLRFEGSSRLLFGDRVVALSRHTADGLLRDGVSPSKVQVVAPPIADLARDESAGVAAREAAGIAPGVPLFVYAGDLEFSGGARLMADAAPHVVEALPEAVIAFACRAKTPRAAEHKARLVRQLAPLGDRARFLGEIDDLPALLSSATALPFPVDDLYGKVDVPYVVLEASLLRVPVLVIDAGPLAELAGAPTIPAGRPDALADWCVEMARDDAARGQLGVQLRRLVRERHDPGAIARQVEAIYEELVGP